MKVAGLALSSFAANRPFRLDVPSRNGLIEKSKRFSLLSRAPLIMEETLSRRDYRRRNDAPLKRIRSPQSRNYFQSNSRRVSFGS